MLHSNCVTAWLVFTQVRTTDGQAWGLPTTTGDAYMEEADALRSVRAMSSERQNAWLKRIVVHMHA